MQYAATCVASLSTPLEVAIPLNAPVFYTKCLERAVRMLASETIRPVYLLLSDLDSVHLDSMPLDIVSSLQSQITRVLSKNRLREVRMESGAMEQNPKLRSMKKLRSNANVQSSDDKSNEQKYTIVFRQVWWLETHNLDSQKARHLQIYIYIIGSLRLSSRNTAMETVKEIQQGFSVHQTSHLADPVDIRRSTFYRDHTPHLNIQQSIMHKANIWASPKKT